MRSFFRTLVQTRRRVRQRATRYSLLVVILLFGLFLEAYMHNFNLVYLILFFLFATAFGAGVFGLLNIGELQASFDHAQRLYPGREGACYFRLSNPAQRFSWAIRLHCDEEVAAIPMISPFETQLVRVAITPSKRGRLQYESCTLQSLFPLSTVRFVLPIEQCLDTVVYPLPAGEPLQVFLQRQRVSFGEESDFDGLAAYSGAESLSRIHWPSVAKGEPAVKVFEQTGRRQKPVFDFYGAGRSDEARLSQLCLWVLECEQCGQPFAIVMPHKMLQSDREGIDAILTYLALY